MSRLEHVHAYAGCFLPVSQKCRTISAVALRVNRVSAASFIGVPPTPMMAERVARAGPRAISDRPPGGV